MQTTLYLLLVIPLTLAACKNKQTTGSGSSSPDQKIENQHKSHLDDYVELLAEFESVCSKITDEASFDQRHSDLSDINEKLSKHSLDLASLPAPSKEVKKNMTALLKSTFDNVKAQSASIQNLDQIHSRKDKIAVIKEDYDSALFGYYMLSYRLYVFDVNSNKYGGSLTSPPEAHIDLSDKTILQFKGKLKSTLFRYLAGNPRWEIRETRGTTYAVRLESANDYQTTLNGFNSFDGKQIRVLISFDKESDYSRNSKKITRATVGQKDHPVIIESPHSGTPGHSSYTIISSGEINLEIYDQAPELKRAFTQTTYQEISDELRDVIKYSQEINSLGVMPGMAKPHYPVTISQLPAFEVMDGFQPGIFDIKASLNPTQSGKTYLKVFNVKTGERLSEERLTPRSTRHSGWSTDGKTYFPYTSNVTVYEGNWTTKYEARFELWHKGKDGTERKIAETQRMINGWQR